MAKWKRSHSLPKRWNRNHILGRYDGLCGVCHKTFEKMGDVTIDHIRPLSKGGQDVVANMQPAHYDCNQLKKDMTPEDFAEYQASFK